jgi:hypothetical protein
MWPPTREKGEWMRRSTIAARLSTTWNSTKNSSPASFPFVCFDPTSYYFRMNPIFETSSTKYDWMNRIIAAGVGHRLPDGPLYSIFEIL